MNGLDLRRLFARRRAAPTPAPAVLPPAQPLRAGTSLADFDETRRQLAQAQALLEQGYIEQAEYEALRARILGDG